MNKGFTLIELLVVVLIIGILAAIALPQYTKAVERSRAAEAMQVLGDLATAQSIYYMQNNKFAEQLETANNKDALNDGDVTFAALPTSDSKKFNYPAWTRTDDAVTMFATRDGGMYTGYTLSITVNKNGSISKACSATKGGAATTDGLCALVKAGGY